MGSSPTHYTNGRIAESGQVCGCKPHYASSNLAATSKMKKKEIEEFATTLVEAIHNIEDHVEILIGKDGSGTLYSLQDIKEEFKRMVENDDLREFEKKHKMFIDQDWEYYWQY